MDSAAERIAELEAENAGLALRVVELEALVAVLLEKIAVLERLVKGDSSNSSRPPSSDPGTAKNKRPIANSRKLSKEAKRAQGKQPGAAGRTLTAVPDPDEVVTHSPSTCRGCGSGLDGAEVTGVATRQVFDIPTRQVVVTEHRAQRRRCVCGCETTAGFPAVATAPACYGPNVKAYAIYLLCRQHIPQERCAETLAEMFGVTVSVGTLNNWLTEAADALDGFVAAVRVELSESPVMHVDETPVRHGKGKAWIHVCSTSRLTLLWASKTRGHAAIAAGPLSTYHGVAVHDRYAAYFAYDCAHALCNAHIIRNLAGIGAAYTHKQWTDPFIQLLCDANNQVNTAKNTGKTALSTRQQRRIRKRWNELCTQALTANPDPPPWRDRNAHERDSYNLATALVTHRDQFLAFTTNFNIAFDNNQAERDVRMMKLQTKISGEFRSLHGAQRFATIRSYISTTTKHQHSVLDHLTRLYTPNGAWLPPPR